MKQLRVLMASAEELVEPSFRKAIEEGSHQLTILNPYEKKGEFLAEAKSGGYDVIVLTNLGSPLDYSMGLISLLRLACNARVIVMSAVADRRKGPPRKGGVPFYLFPLSRKQILKAVEKAAGMSELSR